MRRKMQKNHDKRFGYGTKAELMWFQFSFCIIVAKIKPYLCRQKGKI